MKIRICERVVVWNSTEVANLNPEDFRKLSVPFEGESEEEFLTYLEEYKWELEDIYEEINEDVLNELNKLWEPEWTEYSNSAWNGEDSWLESGEEDESCRKTGGFDVKNSTIKY
jgi:hypothetical protein